MHTVPGNFISWRCRGLGGIYLQNVVYTDIVGTEEDTNCAFSKLPKDVLKILKRGEEMNKNSVFGYSEEKKDCYIFKSTTPMGQTFINVLILY